MPQSVRRRGGVLVRRGRVCFHIEVGFVPAALEIVEEPEFYFGCDVGVDLGHAIR